MLYYLIFSGITRMTFIIFLPGNDLRSEKNEGENILLFLKLYLFAGKISFLGVLGVEGNL